ncbi:GAF domain-containing protein [Cytobacillus depressus]|uniref:GAF domain-containing protein n=1 Tax=Cytobacillus depressus TaxID=1602942 RepID=A0A6L3V7N1_9BACI|nr:helix-turn-helix domain-containing protein [Cytobacillus depressus]KAB2336720.1 GAF domain-containing protein [Cytobacillus depressus]
MKETLTHRQLQSLIHVSNVLNSSLDIDTIIHSIMVQTVSVIDAANGGVLLLYDEKQGRLIPKTESNVNGEMISQVRLKPGESMSGKAFSAGKCLIFRNRAEVEKATADLSEENLHYMLEAIPNLPYSSIAAPIFLKGNCIGVITLDSFEPSLEFTLEDIHLLTAIAHQAAVAIEKAKLYHEQEEAVKQLEYLNDMISKQNHMLSRSVDIHKRLANLVLHGEGLDSIIAYLHEKTGHTVLLFDDLGEMISYAYSHHIDKEDLLLIRKKAQESMHSLKTVHTLIEADLRENPFLTILPIGAKPTLFGTLIIAAPEEIRDVDVAALEHACTVISLEMVKEQAIFDAQERINGEFIDVLLSGKMNNSILQKAKQMNFDPMADYLTLIIRMDELDQKHKRNSIIRHLVQLSNRLFVNNQLNGITVGGHDQIVLLLTFQQKVSNTYAFHQVKQLVSNFQQEIHLKNWGTTISIGIGRIHSTLLKATKSIEEASKCLQFLHSYGKKGEVISFKDLGVQRLLFQNSEEDLLDFLDDAIGPLIAYDQTRKGELLPSLFAYLEHNQNAKEAAEAIHVHTNTLTYRLKRIEEILSISLSDSQQFLNIHLAVSLYPFLKGKK